jgi:hypothetical protein
MENGHQYVAYSIVALLERKDTCPSLWTTSNYDKQDQQGKAAFNERNPHMTQQQEPMGRSPGGPQT